MEKLAVILGVLALSSLSAADIDFICANNLTCPGNEATFASCNFSSTIEWAVLVAGAVVEPVVEFNNTDDYSAANVTVNGIDVSFVKFPGNSSAAFVSLPDASLNGMVLRCTDTEDPGDMTSEQCTIDKIFESSALPPPQNLALDYTTITQSSIVFSWDPPMNHMCRRDDSYLISIRVGDDINNSDSLMTMATLNEMGPGINNENCISISTYGTDDKLGQYTEETCITLDRPARSEININEPMYMRPQMGGMTDVTMRWTYGPDSRPPVMRYYVTHNFTRPSPPPEMSGSGSGDMDGDNMDDNNVNPFITVALNASMSNTYRLMGALEGWTYSFCVVAENVLGNSTEACTVFVIEQPQPTPTVSPTATPTASVVPTNTTTPEEDDEVLPVWAIAVIAVGGAVVLAIILAFVVIIICCCCCGAVACGAAAASSKKRDEHEMTGTKL